MTYTKINGITNMMRKGDNSFTLIELLVVIAMIMLLSMMTLAGLKMAQKNQRRVRAKDACLQIVTAWHLYVNDFREFPGEDLRYMTNVSINYLYGTNATKTKYMEFTSNELVVGSMNDPWGKIYRFAIDNGASWGDIEGYDNKTRPYGSNIIDKAVVSWSSGPNKDDGTSSGGRSDDIVSW